MKLSYLTKRIVRRHIPSTILFKMMACSGYSNVAEDRPRDILQALRDRLQPLEIDLAGKHVLDLGSGRYARLALLMLDAGASRVTLVDSHAIPLNDPGHRAMLEQDCSQLGLDSDDALSRIHLAAGDFLPMPRPLPEERVDLIISTAAMEHMYDPQAIFNRSWEWLKPGGFASHAIDLRDHLFNTPFEMLTYSDRAWDRWIGPKGGFHLNRWRLPDYLQAMRKAGFVDIGYRTMQQDEQELLRILPRLDRRFRQLDIDQLSIMVVHLYARKRTR